MFGRPQKYSLIVAALAGCSAPKVAGTIPNAVQTRAISSPSKANAREVRLFVSDYEALQIYVYSLPSLRLIKTVSNVGQPQGECSDNRGDVWVTSDSPRVTYELNHDGSVVRALPDPFGYPAQGCAWDPTTGDLAITNINFYCCSGDVLIYPGASGTPRQVSDPYGRLYYFVGYDSHGNLFFDGEDLNYEFHLAELPKVGSEHSIEVSGGTIVWPGMVQSAGPGSLYIGDQNCKQNQGQLSCLHHLVINGSSAKITGEIDLLDARGEPLCNMMQGIIWDGHLYGSDFQTCDVSSNATYTWSMPTGGKPLAKSTQQELQPFGAAVSR